MRNQFFRAFFDNPISSVRIMATPGQTLLNSSGKILLDSSGKRLIYNTGGCSCCGGGSGTCPSGSAPPFVQFRGLTYPSCTSIGGYFSTQVVSPFVPFAAQASGSYTGILQPQARGFAEFAAYDDTTCSSAGGYNNTATGMTVNTYQDGSGTYWMQLSDEFSIVAASTVYFLLKLTPGLHGKVDNYLTANPPPTGTGSYYNSAGGYVVIGAVPPSIPLPPSSVSVSGSVTQIYSGTTLYPESGPASLALTGGGVSCATGVYYGYSYSATTGNLTYTLQANAALGGISTPILTVTDSTNGAYAIWIGTPSSVDGQAGPYNGTYTALFPARQSPLTLTVS